MNTSTAHLNSRSMAEAAYYDGPELVDTLTDAITAAGLDPAHLAIDDLAALDQFHALGRPATIALADLAGILPGMRVLDVGAGIGGPARVLASRYRAEVVALDATPRFCRAADMLTRATGLTDTVTIVEGDALTLPFADESFDLVWTQAVAQNVPDKPRMISEMTRVVRPGGHLALFEVLAGPGGPVEFPVPWADRPDQSWLPLPHTFRSLLSDGRLSLVQWREGADVVAAIGEAAAADAPLSEAAGRLSLSLLMPDYEARMAGLARNVARQKIVLVQALAGRSR